jgi:hypothetical protein
VIVMVCAVPSVPFGVDTVDFVAVQTGYNVTAAFAVYDPPKA